MDKAKRWVVVAVVSMAVLAACGGDDAETATGDSADSADSSDSSSDANSPSEDSDDAPTSDDNASAPTDVSDFSIGVPDGGAVIVDTDVEGDRAVVVEYPANDFDRLVEFYQEWTDSEPDEYTRNEAAAGGVTFQSFGDDRIRSIIVSSVPDGSDTTMITLTDAAIG